MNNFNTIAGKRVLISGGSLGIGKAIAKILLQNGARVFIFSRKMINLSAAMAELQHFGEIYSTAGDTASDADITQLFKTLDEKFDVLDILINNAGLGANGIESLPLDEIDYIVSTNLTGYLRCSKMAIGKMTNGGHIINIGSLSGRTQDPGSSVYVATKTGISGFTNSLRQEVSNRNIKVSLIEPGAVATNLHGQPLEDILDQAKNNEMLYAEDIASAVLFCLAQPERVDIINLALKPRKQNI